MIEDAMGTCVFVYIYLCIYVQYQYIYTIYMVGLDEWMCMHEFMHEYMNV